jgi:cobalamin biosynthesis protein CbiG
MTTLATAIEGALMNFNAVQIGGLATVAHKRDEVALLRYAAFKRWPLFLYPVALLATVPVSGYSYHALHHFSVPSVAEAAARLAAGSGGNLIQPCYRYRGLDEKTALIAMVAR